MDKLVRNTIYTLMQYKRGHIDETKKFEKLMHNDDLCPGFQHKIEYIVQLFTKYRTITYDIQGFKDEGTDIVVRYCEKDETEYICFQIKSQTDIESPDYLTKIKCQASDTSNNYSNNLSDYYIILCCNKKMNRSIQNKVRQIEAAFSKRTNVHIIEPEYAITFLHLGEIQIDALVKSKLSEEDIIFRQALNIVSDISPTERGLLYYIVWTKLNENRDHISLYEIKNSNFIRYVYNNIPDYDREWFFQDEPTEHNTTYEENNKYGDVSKNRNQDKYDNENIYMEDDDYNVLRKAYHLRNYNIETRIAEDIDFLGEYYVYSDKNGDYEVDTVKLFPVISLMIDGVIRYEFEENELLLYMMNLFGQMRGYSGYNNQND